MSCVGLRRRRFVPAANILDNESEFTQMAPFTKKRCNSITQKNMHLAKAFKLLKVHVANQYSTSIPKKKAKCKSFAQFKEYRH